MKLKTLSLACAAALAGFSGAASAAVTPFETPDVTVFLTGATAPDNFNASIAAGFFQGVEGTDWFRYTDKQTVGTTVVGRAFTAFFGQVRNDTTVPASLRNKKLLFIKRSKGGSVWGVNPVARAQPVATLEIANGPGQCVIDNTPAVPVYRCNEVGNDPGFGTPTGQERVSDFGVSDVSPALFKEPFNVEFGQDELSPSEVTRLTVTPANVLMMGFAVTNAVPTTTHLSTANYGAALSGFYQTWDRFGVTLPAGKRGVVVCRRVPGSGTQTSYNWYFNNFPCTTGNIAQSGQTPPARQTDSTNWVDDDEDGLPDDIASGDGLTSATAYDVSFLVSGNGYTVVENSGSGDVRACLTAANNGGTHTWRDERNRWFKINFGTGGYGAVGVLSVDSMAVGGQPGYSFRNLDGAGSTVLTNAGNPVTPTQPTYTVTGTGVPPTQDALRQGQYAFAVELTYQFRSVAVGAVPALAGEKLDFVSEFIKRAGDPNFQRPWTASLPPTFDPTKPENAGKFIAKGTRGGNTCRPLQLFF